MAGSKFSLATGTDELGINIEHAARAKGIASQEWADRVSAALRELEYKRMREELQIAGEDSPELARIFRQGYRGSRFSFGYPACPNLEDQAKLFALLEPERIGVELSEEFQLDPEQSTSAIIVHHPEAKYFNI